MKDPDFNAEYITNLCADHANPKICVETGTWKGQRTEIFESVFDKVHSIEIDEKQMRETIERRKWDRDCVQFLLGDSAKLMPAIAFQIQQPVFWFLDAHWFPGIEYHKGSIAAPLFTELKSIASRPEYADIVVVDDVHAFERENWGEDPPPSVVSSWKATNQENIEAVFGNRIRKSFIIHDKLIMLIKPGV